VRFQRLRIELFSRAAIKTSSVSRVVLNERSTQIFVPASEKLSHNPDFVAKHRLIDSVFDILKHIFQRNHLHLRNSPFSAPAKDPAQAFCPAAIPTYPSVRLMPSVPSSLATFVPNSGKMNKNR
jgi:hypothetical protein